jgi:hypothetical protein
VQGEGRYEHQNTEKIFRNEYKNETNPKKLTLNQTIHNHIQNLNFVQKIVTKYFILLYAAII